MVESLMLFALGFLIATLFAIIASQLIWRRAVTVTTRKLTENGQTGAGDEELRNLLAERSNRLTELSARLEKLETKGAPSTDGTEPLEPAGNAKELESLRARLAEMEDKLARSEADRRAQQGRLAEMNQRLTDFDAELESDALRREETRASLHAIGEKAARLAYDLNNIIEEIAPRRKTKPAEENAKAEPTPPAPEPAAGTDGEEGIAESLDELKERVHAAYDKPEAGSASAGEVEDAGADTSAEPAEKPAISPLDERIRALQAGLPH